MSGFLWVCLGGAAGSGARYLVAQWATQRFGPDRPYGTWAVNLVGSFLLVLVVQLAARGHLSATARLALGAGVMGGFTTYSTFNFETLRALEQGRWAMASLNLAVTVLGCLLAGALAWGLTGGTHRA